MVDLNEEKIIRRVLIVGLTIVGSVVIWLLINS
jgi:hypothetical protein